MTPEQTAELRAAFAKHIQRLPGMPDDFPTWHDRNIDLLRRVAAAAGKPNSLTRNLVEEIVFTDNNGICRLNHGCISYQINGYNTQHPQVQKRMPTADDFVPLVVDLLRIRQAGSPLDPEKYLDFRNRFFRLVDMNLAAAANRVVVAVFPDQFTTPVVDSQMRAAYDALVRGEFVPNLDPNSPDLAWFERSSLVVRELRAVLNGVGFDDAYLSSFVWFAHEYFPARGEIRPQGR